MPKATGNTADQADLDKMFGDGPDAEVDDLADVDEDLLNTIEEDDSEGWVPTEKGEGIIGKVVKVGEARSDFAKPGEDPMVPAITIKTREGKFRVIGYGAVLRREIEDADPQVGDTMAVKYWGDKPIKKGPFAGKTYKHFSVLVQKPKTAASA